MFNKKRGKKMVKIEEARYFVNYYKTKYSQLQQAPLSNLMTIIKIKCEKEFGVLFVQNNWESITK
jgi:hypothetical protein